jgi:HSP20 family protein
MTNQTETATNGAEAPKAVATTRPRLLGFPDLFEDMDRLWSNFMPSPWRVRATAGQRLMPALDVFEKGGKLHVNAELPGMQDKDIDIEVTEDVLTISGEKRDEREVKEDDFYRSERSYGRFRRQVALPAGADTDNIEASFKDGVLKVAIPVKAAAASAKKVQVKKD